MGIGEGFSGYEKVILVFCTAFSFWFPSLNSKCQRGPASLYLGNNFYELQKIVDCEGAETGHTPLKNL